MTAINPGHVHVVGNDLIRASGPETFDVISPATEEVVATFPLPSVEDADAAVDAARGAFEHSDWSRRTLRERAEVLERFCQAYERRAEQFSAAWTAENGPTVAHTKLINQFIPIMWRDTLSYAEKLTVDEVRIVTDGKVRVLREPAGVSVIITAWNGPGLYVAMKVVPALLAGCTVILKPAIESQLTARLIAQMAADAGLPEGVLVVVPAGTDVSQHLVSHPGVDKVSVTASVPAGRAVMRACAENITHVTLELGGKSPAIIVGDVPLERFIEPVVNGFIPFQAQFCVALSRVLVPRHRQDEIASALAEALGRFPIGEPTSPSSVLGPLGTRAQYDKVRAYISDAVDEGARLVGGGGRPAGFDRGFYVEPTVLADVTPNMRIAQEEVFGPVQAVIPYDTVEEAIAIANGTEYGLAAAVFADDDQVAGDIAMRIDSGTVAVNTTGNSFFAPFGGYRNSGFGRENGPEGIEEFLRYKAIKLA